MCCHRLFTRWSQRQQQGETRVVRSFPYTRDASSSSPYVCNRITNTKYTLITFLPLSLWHQFGQAMNRYFLLIACLQLWSAITPVAPATTWGPLMVIFAISCLKEAVDDVKRYRTDCSANERLVTVLRDGRRTQIPSEDLLVGDILYCVEDDELPADIVLLQSSESKSGSCYIQTSNLDGETNLKQRFTAHLDFTQRLTEDELVRLDIGVECAHPNKNIYNFDSTLSLPRDWRRRAGLPEPHGAAAASTTNEFPLTSDHLLLQATYLRNTAWIYGLVVYTGNETKLGCNKSKPHQKVTKLDDAINRVTIIVFVIQILMIIVWGVVGYELASAHQQAGKDSPTAGWWYLDFGPDRHAAMSGLIVSLRFLLLASMMIPISLKVSLDLVKLYYAWCINCDLGLYDAERDVPAKAANTSITENLGQVGYCLTDKTGTLTENCMVFRQMRVVGGRQYGDEQMQPPVGARRRSTLSVGPAALPTGGIHADPCLVRDLRANQPPLVEMLRFMALCNTVVPSWSATKAPPQITTTYNNDRSSGTASSPHSHDRSASASPTRNIDIMPNATGHRVGGGSVVLPPVKTSLEMVSSMGEVEAHGLIQRGSINSLAPERLYAGGGRSASVSPSPGSGSASASDTASPTTQPPGVHRLYSADLDLECDDDDDNDPKARRALLRHTSGSSHPSDSSSRVASATSVPSDLMLSASFTQARGFERDASFIDSVAAQHLGANHGSHHLPSHHHHHHHTRTLHYASSSPDELSLVEFASSVGLVLLEREGSTSRILVDPRVRHAHEIGVHAASSLSHNAREHHEAERTESWEVLAVLEFTSDRKRMSVVARRAAVDGAPAGPIMLYTKGADDVVFARLAAESMTAANGPSSHASFRATLDSYASQGLRTLCFASRVVSAEEYERWSTRLHAANLDIHHREARLSEAYESLEHDLTLLGCTGIEDKLQDGVPETIDELRRAGIKVWMLTGDKWATALEISQSCGLYKPRVQPRFSAPLPQSSSAVSPIQGDVLYELRGETPTEVVQCLDRVVRELFSASLQARRRPVPPLYCLIVDGGSLATLLAPEVEARFALVALRAVSVICARTTPSQKANMVTLVKKYASSVGAAPISDDDDEQQFESDASDEAIRRTLGGRVDERVHLCSLFSSLFGGADGGGGVVLAIGDGGNDVSMIQVSDVGIGIVGKEGLQAARAADFSFSRFAHLKRLILVHGRYAFHRTAFVAQYCFFKSLLICLVQLFFAFASDFSGASYFDSFSLATYNLFYGLCPLLFVLEKDLSEAFLLKNPEMYATSRRGDSFSRSTLFGWAVRAVVQAALLILFAFHTHHGGVASLAFGGEGQISNALVIYTACVFIHPITIYLECTSITWVHHFVLIGSMAFFFVSNMIISSLTPVMTVYHIFPVLLADGEYYLRALLATTACILPVLAWKYGTARHAPSLVQQAHEAEVLRKAESLLAHPDADEQYHPAP